MYVHIYRDTCTLACTCSCTSPGTVSKRLWISQSASLLSNLLYLQGDMIRHGFFPRKAQLRVPAKSWWPKTKQRKMSTVKSMVEDSGSLQWRWDFRAKAFLKLRALGQGQWVRAEFSSRSAGSKIYTWQFQLVDLNVPRFSNFWIQSMIMIPDGVVEWLCLRAFVSAAKLADGDTAHWRGSAGLNMRHSQSKKVASFLEMRAYRTILLARGFSSVDFLMFSEKSANSWKVSSDISGFEGSAFGIHAQRRIHLMVWTLVALRHAGCCMVVLLCWGQ